MKGLDEAVLLDFILLMVSIICLYSDLTRRKIYNKVVYPAVAAGLLLNTVGHGLTGFEKSLAGLGLGVALMLLPFMLGGLGAGDVKLLGAVGALKGPLFVFYAALGAALAGGAIALIAIFCQGRLQVTLGRLACFLSFWWTGLPGGNQQAAAMLDQTPYSESIPYGVAILAGTFLVFLLRGYLPW